MLTRNRRRNYSNYGRVALGLTRALPYMFSGGNGYSQSQIDAVQNLAKQAKKAYTSYARKKKPARGKPKQKATPRKNAKKVKKMAKVLKQVACRQNQVMGEHHYRNRKTGRVLGLVNSAVHTVIEANTNSLMENAGSSMRYFDSGAPGLPDEINISDGTYTHPTCFKNMYHSLTVRNNYIVPCHVKIYALTAKVDHGKSVALAYSEGLSDKEIGISTSPLTSLTDSDIFNKLWKIKKVISRVIGPGNTLVLANIEKEVTYYPSLVDSHSDSYQPKHKPLVYVIRLEGVLGHDTADDQQGRIKCAVDYELNSRYQIRYPAGRNIKTLVVADVSNTFTDLNGRCTNEPITDNQQWGIS